MELLIFYVQNKTHLVSYYPLQINMFLVQSEEIVLKILHPQTSTPEVEENFILTATI
jgi:hypothetical protein